MKWYVAYCLMLFRFRDGNQDTFPLWENLILIRADSHEQAGHKARDRAKRDELDEPSTTWDDRPVTTEFVGVRKTVECQDGSDRPGDGTEVTYNELSVATREQFDALLAGDEVTVVLAD